MTKAREGKGVASPHKSIGRASASGDEAPSSVKRLSLTRWLSQSSQKALPEKESSSSDFYKEWGITKEKEAELLQDFRRQVEQDVGRLRPFFDDFYLRRFLRARGHDLSKAKAMFLAHLKFRKDYGVDTVLEDFDFQERDAVLSIYPQGYHKTDKEGRPVYIQHLGQVNLKTLTDITTEERMLKYHVQEYERCLKYIFPACSKVAGHQVNTTFAILDVKGVGLKHLTGETRRILSEIVEIDSNNYPETLGKTLIINAPSMFAVLFKAVKPMLDARTQAKIKVCSSSYLSELRKYVDDENIPSYLGGKSKGSLVDDVGPWQQPQLIAEINAEVAARDGLPPPPGPVSAASVEAPAAAPEPKVPSEDMVAAEVPAPEASEEGGLTMGEEVSSTTTYQVTSAFAGQSGGEFLRKESFYMDAEDYYDASSRRGSMTSYVSGDESTYSSPRMGFASEAGSPLVRLGTDGPGGAIPTVHEGEVLPDVLARPSVSIGSRIQEDGLQELAGRDSEGQDLVLKAGLQIPILARVRALEQRFPDVEKGLRRQLSSGDNLPSRSIGTGTLLSRVVALERAMDTLLVAQETVLEETRRSGAVQPENPGACGCCTVM
ncbi:SEC14 [Auxenochlorella protothecoides x Auxenochlorella symbiontica]|uniref:CRAL-TRIO domain-containing protein n=1 Tax=Auxenochlorella protothecoides TaxID=3075 RepID=A0A1D2A3A0_AUXPR